MTRPSQAEKDKAAKRFLDANDSLDLLEAAEQAWLASLDPEEAMKTYRDSRAVNGVGTGGFYDAVQHAQDVANGLIRQALPVADRPAFDALVTKDAGVGPRAEHRAAVAEYWARVGWDQMHIRLAEAGCSMPQILARNEPK